MYTTLRLATPPAVEPVTVAQAMAHCRIDIDDTTTETLLQGLIITARTMAENFLSRALITQTLLWAFLDAPYTGDWLSLPYPTYGLPFWDGLPMLWQKPLALPRSPVQAVTQIAIGSPQGGPDTILDPATDYTVDLNFDPARLIVQPAYLVGPLSHILVTFQAGYGDEASNVPAPIITAILFLVAWLYENRGDAPDSPDMPKVVERLLWPYRVTYFG